MNESNENMIGGFESGWVHRFAADNSVSDVIEVSDGGKCALLTLDKAAPVLQKYEYAVQIKNGVSYEICVKYETFNTASVLSAYGLISLYDSAGTVKRRMYLKRPVCGKLSLKFKSEGEERLVLELGLKQSGSVRWYRPVLKECEPLTKRNVKIAAAHIAVDYNGSYEKNLERISAAIDKAAKNGADIISFAETIADRGTGIPTDKIYEPIDGSVCSLMRKKAAEYGCYIMFTFHELDGNGLRHNTAVLTDRNGNIAGRYIKTHQALVEYEKGQVPGNAYPVFDTDFGRIGMLICWDAYFPEPAKAMVKQGAEILFVSTAGNPTYRHIARAKDNGVYVVVACASQQGDSGIQPTKIISPSGEILAHTAEDGECAFAEIDLNKNDYIYWLSVGGANSNPKEVYENECRDDMYGYL